MRTSGSLLFVGSLLLVGACTTDGSDTASPCLAGHEDCDGVCVDLLTDPGHCGSCIRACGGGLVCLGGTCAGACAASEQRCGAVCVDVMLDVNHCGGCDNACPASQACSGGACASDCSGGTTLCAGVCVDTMVDDTHCGGCDSPCPPPSVCTAGMCSGTDPCGNGSLDATEECDDGNEASADGCDPACQVECSVGGVEDPSSHHCYLEVATPLPWAAARTSCIAIAPGWELIALGSQAELTFADDVVNVASDNWVGATDQAMQGIWVWSNGEPWGFAPWALGEPNGSGDCARSLENPGSGDDQLRDTSCFLAYPYVCELTPAGS